MLIKRGAKVNVQDHKKNTPVMVAAFFNKPKIMQYLIEQEADISIRNNEDKDAYDVAEEKDHYECKQIISRFLEKSYKKQPASSSQIECAELAKNFEIRNRIR
jgi:ankyrin repeat protein